MKIKTFFKSKGGLNSVTQKFGIGFTSRGSDNLRVIDIPGFQDTNKKEFIKQAEMVVTEMTNALIHARDGLDVVLLVYPFNKRMGQNEKRCIDFFLRVIDRESFKKKGIVVITFGDQFHRENGDKDIVAWIKETNSSLREMIGFCEDRCVLFDNVSENQHAKDAQVDGLLKMMKGFESQAKYTPSICAVSEIDSTAATQIAHFVNIVEVIGVLVNLLTEDDRSNPMEDTNTAKTKAKDLLDMLTDSKVVNLEHEALKILQTFVSSYDGSEEMKKEILMKTLLHTLLATETFLQKTKHFLITKKGIQDLADLLVKALF